MDMNNDNIGAFGQKWLYILIILVKQAISGKLLPLISLSKELY